MLILILIRLFIYRSSIELNTRVFFLGKPARTAAKTTEDSFERFLSIYRYWNFFASLKLRHCRTIVLLNKLRLLKKSLQKRRRSCDFPPRKTLVAQKHRAISGQEKMAFSSPRRVALGLPSPSTRVCCTEVRADVRWRHNQNFSHRYFKQLQRLILLLVLADHFKKWPVYFVEGFHALMGDTVNPSPQATLSQSQSTLNLNLP